MGKLLSFFSALAVLAVMTAILVVSGIGMADEDGAKDQNRIAELQETVRKEVKVIQGKDGQTFRVETIIVGDDNDGREEGDAGDEGDPSDEGDAEPKIQKRIESRIQIDGDGVDVRLEKGKLIIRLPDGTEQEIDLPSVDGVDLPDLKARDIELDIEVEGGDTPQKADVDIDVQVTGKAIIVDSDGNVREIELGPDAIVGEGAGTIIGGPGFSGAIESGIYATPIQFGKYMIGVGINDASPALRSQLSLDDGTGVVVSYVGDDSPAAKAGIEMFDVIVSAGDRVIHNLPELIEVVNANGEKEQAIALSLIRKGEKKTVEVTPVKRPEGEIQDAPIAGFPGFEAIPHGHLEAYGIPADEFANIQKHLQEQMKHLGKNGIKGEWQAAPVIPGPNFIPHAGFGKQIEMLEKMEKRIKHLEKRLEQLESR